MWLKLTNARDQLVGVDFDRVIRIDARDTTSIIHFEQDFPENLRILRVKESVDQIIAQLNETGTSERTDARHSNHRGRRR